MLTCVGFCRFLTCGGSPVSVRFWLWPVLALFGVLLRVLASAFVGTCCSKTPTCESKGHAAPNVAQKKPQAQPRRHDKSLKMKAGRHQNGSLGGPGGPSGAKPASGASPEASWRDSGAARGVPEIVVRGLGKAKKLTERRPRRIIARFWLPRGSRCGWFWGGLRRI